MNNDEIIEFAKEAGLLDCIDDCYEERGDFVAPLIKFAELVIEDYKSSLVPVALRYYTFYKSGFTEDVEDFVLYPHAEKLYALEETK